MREKARIKLQERVDTLKTQEERNRLGQFATSPDLAWSIVAYAVSLLPPHVKIRFLEPGFGTGPFYSALLRQVPPSHIESSVGYEIDPNYAEPAKRFWEESGLGILCRRFYKSRATED